MVTPLRQIATPAMPDIKAAQPALADLAAAVQRANAAWNRSQLDDALRSAEHFIAAARAAAQLSKG